jgi:hypothetical protein
MTRLHVRLQPQTPGASDCKILTHKDSIFVAPQLQGAATAGGIGDSLFFCSAPQGFVVLGVFCARFPRYSSSGLGRPVLYYIYLSLFIVARIAISGDTEEFEEVRTAVHL